MGPEPTNEETPLYFNTAKGNLLQFIGILLFTLAIPFVFFSGSRSIGVVLAFFGLGFYATGRFINWYFWYRLQ